MSQQVQYLYSWYVPRGTGDIKRAELVVFAPGVISALVQALPLFDFTTHDLLQRSLISIQKNVYLTVGCFYE